MKKIYTVKELEAMKAAFEDRIREAKEEIAANQTELEEVAGKMDAATLKGDIAEYKRLHTRRAELELNMEAVQAIMDSAIAQNACGFTDEDVNAAWAAYVEPFNKKAQERETELRKLQDALYNRYVQMAKEQNEVLKMRDKLAQFLTTASLLRGMPTNFTAINGVPEPNSVFSGMKEKSEAERNQLYCVCYNLDAVDWRD